MRAAWIIALTSCGGQVAPTANVRPVSAPADAGVRDAAAVVTPQPDDYLELERVLRTARDPDLLGRYVDHRVVLLDPHGVRSLCDRAAIDAARGWEQLVTDPARSDLHCDTRNDHTLGCAQASNPLVDLTFVHHPGRWQLVSVDMFDPDVPGDFVASIAALHAEVAHGTCR